MAPTIQDDRLEEHWTALRSNLHDPSSWSNRPDISLTYVPTLSGFSGPSQRDHYCAVHGPPTRHPFHPHTSSRFNNRLHRLALHADHQRATITEEVTLSVLHMERMEWLLPGQEETRKVLNVQMVIVGRLDEEQPHLLHTVRVYWEQAGVWKESGLLAKALHGAARAGVKGFDEAALEHLLPPIPDGARVNVRLMNPTPFNCNQLTPLDHEHHPPTTTSPALTTMTLLLHELPADPNTVVLKRDHPAFKGHYAILGDEELLKAGEQVLAKCGEQGHNNPVFKTTMHFQDHHADPPVDPKHKAYRAPNFFDDPNPQYRPNISIDPTRNKSSVFDADPLFAVSNQQSRQLDGNRPQTGLVSSGCESGNMKRERVEPTVPMLNPQRFHSHITSPAQDHLYLNTDKQTRKQMAQPAADSTILSSVPVAAGNMDPSRFQSTMDFAGMNCGDSRPVASVSASRGNVLLGDDDAGGRVPTAKRIHKANSSSISFDFDHPQSVSVQPSTRYLALFV